MFSHNQKLKAKLKTENMSNVLSSSGTQDQNMLLIKSKHRNTKIKLIHYFLISHMNTKYVVRDRFSIQLLKGGCQI